MSAATAAPLQLLRAHRHSAPSGGESLLLVMQGTHLCAAESGTERRILSADELARATRFRRREDRDAFVAARIVLRSLLATWCGIDPGSIQFSYNSFGKPSFPGAADIHFNIAHSSGMVAVAFAGVPVGVDIEMGTHMPAATELAAYFTRRERDALEHCPESRRSQLLLHLWTLKEAYLKARGVGLSLALDSFGFDLGEDEAEIGFAAPADDDAKNWHFHCAGMDCVPRWALALKSAYLTSKPLLVRL